MARLRNRRTRASLAALALVALVVLAGGCSDDGGGDDDEGGSATSTSTGDTTTGTGAPGDDTDGGEGDGDAGEGEGEGSSDTSMIPADQLGADICEALPGEAVGEAAGVTVTGTDGYGLGTPQCSYSFDHEGTITTISVAAQRTEEDLGGLTGRDALDAAVSANEVLVENEAETRDVTIEGAEAAVAIDGRIISGVIVLADDGKVYTIFSPALSAEQLEAVATRAADALSG